MKNLLMICIDHLKNTHSNNLNMIRVKYYPDHIKSKFSAIQKLKVLLNHPEYAFRLGYQKIKLSISVINLIIRKKVSSKLHKWGTL